MFEKEPIVIMLFDKYGMLIREESNYNVIKITSLIGVTFPITSSYQLGMFPSTYSMNSSNPSKSTNYSKFENDRKELFSCSGYRRRGKSNGSHEERKQKI